VWENYHLYEFRIAGAMYRDPHPENEPQIQNSKRTRISNVLSGVGAELECVYDFGDYWQHDLVLEAILVPTLMKNCHLGKSKGKSKAWPNRPSNPI
jgi:hypothetical protein